MARGTYSRTVRTAPPPASADSDAFQQIKTIALWIAYLILFGLSITGAVLVWPYIRFGLIGAALGVTCLLALVRYRPGWVLRRPNLVAGYALLVLGFTLALSLRHAGWGGRVGDTVAAWPTVAGISLVVLVTLAALLVALPRPMLAASRATLTGSVWTSRTLYAAFHGLHRATSAAMDWYRNSRIHGALVSTFWSAAGRLNPRWRRRAEPVVDQELATDEGIFAPEDGEADAAGAPRKKRRDAKQAPVNEQAKAPARLNGKSGNGFGGWKLPHVSILREEPKAWISEEENLEKARLIEQTLADYGIEVEIQEIRPGPVVTQFGVVPGWVRKVREVKERDKDGRPKLDRTGKPIIVQVEDKLRVRVDTILSREKDLSLALAAKSLRFEAPVPGESFVGLEVPNLTPTAVTLRGAMESDAFKTLAKKGRLPIALGKGSGGEVVVADLADMPHLLIAGATGSGKSVCMNTIIGSLLMQLSPFHLRLLMTDPKRVELTPYNGIPHLALPVVVEPDQAVPMLRSVIHEMQERYKRLEAAGVRNIHSFNDKAHTLQERMPYLVLVIDELADLMMASSVDVEHSLCRLAQLGRAVGIHLVVATQRPSVDVITGLIKANFPSRISFAVTSQVDSRTILDHSGAEKLLGRGDMLYSPIGAPKPKRVQGAYVSDEEIAQIVSAWKEQQGTPVPPFALLTEEESEQQDEMLERAKELANEHRSLSASLLQRKLSIGYPRASRLLDRLQELGFVAAGQQGKSRQVISLDGDDPDFKE
jgi:S-DNA-T family DNA segregation ATPase FtsK/SpoIIIE